MTDEELSVIRERWNKTTPGPWTSFVEGRDHTAGSHFIRTEGEADIELTGASVEDQDFIAHCHQDIPHLLDEVARLKKLLANL